MRFILIAFALLLVFFLSSRVKLFHTEDSSTPSSVLHIWEFAVAICRKKLPQEFAVGICRRYLLWLFAARICRGNLPWLFSVGFLYIQVNPFLYMWANLVYMEANLFYMCAKLFDLWDFLYQQCFFLLLSWQLWATVLLKGIIKSLIKATSSQSEPGLVEAF